MKFSELKKVKFKSTLFSSILKKSGKTEKGKALFSERIKNLFERKNTKASSAQYSEYSFSPKELVKITGTVMTVFILFSVVFYNSVVFGLALSLPGIYFWQKKTKKKKIEKRKRQLKKEFAKGILLLGDYLRSGYSVENGILKSVPELEELFGKESDLVREWKDASAKLKLNVTPEEIFSDFGKRSQIPEIMEFAELFGTVKRTGGQICEVIGSSAACMTAEFATDEQIETLVTAKKLEQKIMNCMPVGILLYVRITSPDMVSVLYETGTGRILTSVCLVFYLAAVFWAEKLSDIRM